MAGDWQLRTLADVAEIVMGQSPPGSTYNSDGDGLPFLQGSAEFGRYHPLPAKWCTSPRKCAEAGDLLLSVRAPVGATNVATQRTAIGRGLAIVRGREATTPFLAYALQHAVPAMLRRSGGGMFSQITKKGLAGLVVPVPPLDDQRRIVDLLQAVEFELDAALELEDAAHEALERFLDEFQPRGDVETLGAIATLRTGPSWKSDDEISEPTDDSLPVVGITNTPAGRPMDVSEIRYVRGLPKNVPLLKESSLVLIRTNGRRERIGNVYRVPPEAVGASVSAFQIAVEPTGRHTEYLYWFLRAPAVQHRITASASGTTGLGNVAVSWLRSLEVPWPSDDERNRYTAVAGQLDEQMAAAHEQVLALEDLRTQLLHGLLTGDHRIPASYDAMLEAS